MFDIFQLPQSQLNHNKSVDLLLKKLLINFVDYTCA